MFILNQQLWRRAVLANEYVEWRVFFESSLVLASFKVPSKNLDRALELAQQAVAIDPEFALAHSCICYWLSLRRDSLWMADEAAGSDDVVTAAD